MKGDNILQLDITSAEVYLCFAAVFSVLLGCYFFASKPKKGTVEWIEESSKSPLNIAGSGFELVPSDITISAAVFVCAFILKLFSGAANMFRYPLDHVLGNVFSVVPEFMGELWLGEDIAAFMGIFAFGGIAALVYIFSKMLTGNRNVALLSACVFTLAAFGNVRYRQYTMEKLELTLISVSFINLLSFFMFYRGMTLSTDSSRGSAFVYFLTAFLLAGFAVRIRPSAVLFSLAFLPGLVLHIWDISKSYLKTHRPGKLVLYTLSLILSYALFSIALPEFVRKLTWDYSSSRIYAGVFELFVFFEPGKVSYLVSGLFSFCPFSVLSSIVAAVVLFHNGLCKKLSLAYYFLFGIFFIFAPYFFSLATGTESMMSSAISSIVLSLATYSVYSRGSGTVKTTYTLLLCLCAAVSAVNYFIQSQLLF